MPDEKAPSSGAFLLKSLMYFCSGQPMHYCSGVDRMPICAEWCQAVWRRHFATQQSSKNLIRSGFVRLANLVKKCFGRYATPSTKLVRLAASYRYSTTGLSSAIDTWYG